MKTNINNKIRLLRSEISLSYSSAKLNKMSYYQNTKQKK